MRVIAGPGGAAEVEAPARRGGRWLVVAAVCATVAGFSAFSHVLMDAEAWPHLHPTRWELVAQILIHWTLWAALFPLFDDLVRRFPPEGPRRLRSVFAYLAFAPVAVALHGVVYLALMARAFMAFYGDAWALASPSAFLVGLATLDLAYRMMGCCVLLATTVALDYQQRARRDAERAAELQTLLAQSQLDALRMQLHPHFLFNTLHSIAALLRRDPAGAERMIARLADFLRLTLHSNGDSEIPLEQELEFIRNYLAIEQVRFSDRLVTRLEISPEVATALVPNLLLQPLVENAIRHGIAQLTRPGTIVVRARRDRTSLQLEVCDDGPGPQGDPLGNGLGLANTALRLRALYGDAHRFHCQAAPGGGCVVAIELPFRDGAPCGS